MHLLTSDPLIKLGVFLLGASAGSLLIYIQDRGVINHYKQELEKASLLCDIGESLLTDIHEHSIAPSTRGTADIDPEDRASPMPDES